MFELNAKQTRFVQEYLIDLNATDAYRRAGYTTGNPDVCGPRLLGNVGVARAIQEAATVRAARVHVTQDMVVQGLLLEAKRTDEGSSHSARVQAWTTLARHLGMLNDKLAMRVNRPAAEVSTEMLLEMARCELGITIDVEAELSAPIRP